MGFTKYAVRTSIIQAKVVGIDCPIETLEQWKLTKINVYSEALKQHEAWKWKGFTKFPRETLEWLGCPL